MTDVADLPQHWVDQAWREQAKGHPRVAQTLVQCAQDLREALEDADRPERILTIDY